MKKALVFISSWYYLFFTNVAFAQFKEDVNLGAGQTKGINPATNPKILNVIIANALTILIVVGGIGFIFMLVWGAVEWIFSGGDKEKVAAARKRITHAIVGIVLLALTFIIVMIVGKIINFNPLDPTCLPILNALPGALSSDSTSCL